MIKSSDKILSINILFSMVTHLDRGYGFLLLLLDIIYYPTTFKGVRMGEGFKPELVTVQTFD